MEDYKNIIEKLKKINSKKYLIKIYIQIDIWINKFQKNLIFDEPVCSSRNSLTMLQNQRMSRLTNYL
jgi:hypothetical protein